MTLQPTANQDNVLYGSGIFGGYSVNLHRNIPSALATSTTGGGGVSAQETGTRLNCGATAGDTAKLLGNDIGSSWHKMSVHVRAMVVEPQAAPPYNSDCETGLVSDDGGNPTVNTPQSSGAYLDWASEEINIFGSTQSVSNMPDRYQSVGVAVISDGMNGETTVELWGDSDYRQSFTQTGLPVRFGDGVVVMNSNGTDEQMDIKTLREATQGVQKP